ncbi:hypothetical protein PRABACTJOHN_00114 [Parabacteroides johnsonii DSM 18315]|uniref:Uncharacterized protein n=1 Tax=Parabacteroides johnsonii DSM 18315 TaxID=537006 RepID=B7B522_9BACT|nr:hypothetical protein PRABACTJOHN_00114 [Parabacteroides johnsonii DSM 18315]
MKINFPLHENLFSPTGNKSFIGMKQKQYSSPIKEKPVIL